jgi:dehydrogenase/reductase SDR family protein 1
MVNLRDMVALVTGASRGVGRGIALGLGEAGATVYVTGRTVEEGTATVALPGTIGGTAEEVSKLGGRGVAIRCDHRDDDQTRAAFDRIRAGHGRLDVLVNCAWGGYEHFYDGTEFWKEREFWTFPLSRWDRMFTAGVRSAYVCSHAAAPMMIAQQGGLIVHVSSFAAVTVAKHIGVAYGTAHATIDQLALRMAEELRPHDVAVVSLYPGLVRTEGVMTAEKHFDLSNSESPQFSGRAVAHLAVDPDRMNKSGRPLVGAELALEYGFTDIDGKQPRSLRAS